MPIRLLILLICIPQIILGQAVTLEGKITNTRSEFVNKAGKRFTLDGVLPSGKLDALPPCTNLRVVHVAGAGRVAPVNKTITYELAYSSITGTNKCWLLQNLGSTNQPSSATDATENAAGWYWQFGSKTGYKYTTTRTPSTTWPNRTLTNTDWSAAQDPCTIELGTGWRLPTYQEWRTISINYRYEANIFASDIKLHNAGWLRQSDGLIQARGITTHYWSSTSDTDVNARGFVIPTAGGTSTSSTNDKDAGFSIRCIRD